MKWLWWVWSSMVSRMKVLGEMAVGNWRAVLNGKMARKCKAATHCAAYLDPLGFVFMDFCACLRISCERKGVEEYKDCRLRRSNWKSPTEHIFPMYPLGIWKGPTRTHTIEITALGSLYVVCHCLGGMRFYRTSTIRLSHLYCCSSRSCHAVTRS